MTEKDIFGLKKMHINQEVAASFTLFTAGTILVLATLYPLSASLDVAPAYLGLIMIATGYLFSIESVRELEEKDHFLSRKLMKKTGEE